MYISLHVSSAWDTNRRAVSRVGIALVSMHIQVADGYISRARGLLFRGMLPAGQVLYIPNCRCVHTFGMRYPLTIIFMDNAGNAIRLIRKVVPNRIAMCRHASAVCELAWRPEGQGPSLDLRQLEWSLTQLRLKDKKQK